MSLPKRARNSPLLMENKVMGARFEVEWRSDEALGTKSSASKSCIGAWLCCKVCATVPQRQKLSTIRCTIVRFDRAYTLRCTIDRVSLEFSRLNSVHGGLEESGVFVFERAL